MNRKGKQAPTTRYGCRGPGCGFSLCRDCYNIRHKDIHVSYYYRSSSFSSLFGIWLFFLSFFHFVFSLVVFSAISTSTFFNYFDITGSLNKLPRAQVWISVLVSVLVANFTAQGIVSDTGNRHLC